jgi:hypothetical protein
MARSYEPDDFIVPRETSEGREHLVRPLSREREVHDQVKDERTQRADPETKPGAARSPKLRTVYEIRGRTYRLRTSEMETMLELGKFRAIAQEDLTEFVYASDRGRMRPDVENLIRQGLVQAKSVPHAEKGARQLLSLTKAGHRFLAEHSITGEDQALYYGFAKAREAHHDADLYRLYQKVANEIEGRGGRNLRVVLDYELKKRVYQDLAKLGPDGTSPEGKRAVSERHGLRVVRGKIPLPDVRIEYDKTAQERARVNIELATSHYRGRLLAEKVRAGFSIYALASDAPILRRVLDQRELTAEILSL